MLSASQFLKHRVSCLPMLNKVESDSTDGDPDDACQHPHDCNIFSVLVNGATDRLEGFFDESDEEDGDEVETPSTTTTAVSPSATMSAPSPTATAPTPHSGTHTPKSPLHSISHCPSFNSVAQALPHSLSPHSLCHTSSHEASRRGSAEQPSRTQSELARRIKTENILNSFHDSLEAAYEKCHGGANPEEHQSNKTEYFQQKLKGFAALDVDEQLIADYPVWLLKNVLIQGHLYITAKHMCFLSYLPRRQNANIRSGTLVKARKRSLREGTRYWCVLKNDSFSYYPDSTDVYFPAGTIDLSEALAAELCDDEGDVTEPESFRIVMPKKSVLFKADSHSAAHEWVKALQKEIFRAHNQGDTVRIVIPLQNIVDLEKTKIFEFATTIKTSVVESNETYAIDEYIFTFFKFGDDVLRTLTENGVEISGGNFSPRQSQLAVGHKHVTESVRDSTLLHASGHHHHFFHSAHHESDGKSNSKSHTSSRSHTPRNLTPQVTGEQPHERDEKRDSKLPRLPKFLRRFKDKVDDKCDDKPTLVPSFLKSRASSRRNSAEGSDRPNLASQRTSSSTLFPSAPPTPGSQPTTPGVHAPGSSTPGGSYGTTTPGTPASADSVSLAGTPGVAAPVGDIEGLNGNPMPAGIAAELKEKRKSGGATSSGAATGATTPGGAAAPGSTGNSSPGTPGGLGGPGAVGAGGPGVMGGAESAPAGTVPQQSHHAGISVVAPHDPAAAAAAADAAAPFTRGPGSGIPEIQDDSDSSDDDHWGHIGTAEVDEDPEQDTFKKKNKRFSTLSKVSDLWSGSTKHYGKHHTERLGDDDDKHLASAEEITESNERFQKRFALGTEERLIASYHCHLHRGGIPTYGKMYVSTNYVTFRSFLRTKTLMIVPLKVVENATKDSGFKFGYSGLVLTIQGYEEIFFEFASASHRDDAEVMLLRQLDIIRPHINDDIKSDDQYMLQSARLCTYEDALKAEANVEMPPVIIDGNLASVLPGLVTPQSKMLFTLLTIGSRGDVQPYISLGKALIEEGHRVRIATHSEFKDWIEGYGIEFKEVAGDPSELMKIMVDHGVFSVSFLRDAASKFRGWINELLASSWEACQGSDVLIESPSAMAGIHIAEALQIPYFRAFTMPWSRTRAYPHAFIVPDQKMGGSYNYLTYVMFDNVFWKGISGQVNRWRKKTLHLPRTNLDHMEQNKVPFLYNVSPAVLPPPVDFPDWIKITGYWFLDEGSKDYTPDDKLCRFMEKARNDGKKLVYIGFGSIVVSDPTALTKSVVESVLKADVRCILNKGWSDRLGKKDAKEPEIPLPEEVLQITNCPHDWLFPQIDACVHHGGSGTTGAGLRAGLPTIIKPFFGDQFFYANRVEDLGAGIHLRKLNVSQFSKALWEATHNERIIAKAAAVGRQIRSENGVISAIQAIYRDLDYARSLVQKKRGYTPTSDKEEETWTLVDDIERQMQDEVEKHNL
ncbi:sterol 3-beta-glucosyltransferase [Yarrowia lipolytica]|uniref:Sterol 3-beta-glucosyltransferase n=1 Tax=Yarrowia lipolytica (strain CLIB 122 / E 150) TaxID=284591 RepID=ATG26_YARLI|nr:YALI0D18403p [Yarrowia lipolytica CLIB122]Q6C8M8.3 RecName: Full=Sterol 3-beta-glucosyltransferase; AltName: Full=Autophagy-related protein 26 [Yarrowia lipolytica CLIB122]RDW29863.1 sterol 3-beta-glucosyltransferase [Yarrowia lipolytica]RDW44137.1 sterol 3-beta-glucosyltransferase [Yarrowia lipolytica]RDW51075.1 sterol 3-beta-glucosyltransferase [Yarrowia lipolytica]CAG81176.2 YALI0D18403p [Yarrowia lipolytica CLIB122]|eukprot:XP_502984.2 YALI0D18403p [Yarrowia lipolytica CLIB122]